MHSTTTTQITLKLVRLYDPNPDQLFGDLPNQRPINVPDDADSWFIAALWEGDHLVIQRAGWFERDAVCELFLAINTATIDAMLMGAKETIDRSEAGSTLGSITSDAKATAARENGKLGGRPRKSDK